jgi:hypothetical protein
MITYRHILSGTQADPNLPRCGEYGGPKKDHVATLTQMDLKIELVFR